MGEAWTTNLSVREVVPLIDVQVGLCWKGLSVECPCFRVVVLILQWGGKAQPGIESAEILKSFGLHTQQTQNSGLSPSTLNSEFHHWSLVSLTLRWRRASPFQTLYMSDNFNMVHVMGNRLEETDTFIKVKLSLGDFY